VDPHHKSLKGVNVKMTMSIFIIELGFPMMAIIIGYEAQLTFFSMEYRAEYLAYTIHHILDFFPIVIYPF
jgi:hypothetical protein